jgi:hypothetical protein
MLRMVAGHATEIHGDDLVYRLRFPVRLRVEHRQYVKLDPRQFE